MNKSRLAVYLSVGFFLAGALLFYGAIRIALPSAAAAKSISLLQAAIHTADEIELSILSDPNTQPAKGRYRTKSFPEDYAITSSRMLTAEQTKAFLSILEAHVFSTSGGAMCHDPGFIVRFRRHGREILSGSLCLHCSNLEVEPFPFAPIWIAIYDPKSKDMRLPRMESFLANLNGA